MRALLAAFVTGAAVYFLVARVAMPYVSTHLTAGQIQWLRDALTRHAMLVMVTVVLISMLLAFPVLAVFMWVYGPLRGADGIDAAD
jgi:hypothetical protein